MFNKIGAWLIRKGIWFLLILFGLVAAWNFTPVWNQLEEAASEATTAEVEGPKAKDALVSLRSKSLELVEQAGSLTQTALDQLIAEEESNVKQLQIDFLDSNGAGVTRGINRIVIKGKLDFATWRKDEYTSLKNTLLAEADRIRKIPIKEAELRQLEAEYARKKGIYDQSVGFGTNSTVNSIASSAISGINKLIDGTDWEVKDVNKAYEELKISYNALGARQKEIDGLKQPTALLSRPPPNADRWLNEINEQAEGAKKKLESHPIYTRIIIPAIYLAPVALLALALTIIFSPLSRFITYYLLAPIAARQQPIVFNSAPSTSNGLRKQSDSAAGLTIHLAPGNVLLAHHDYVKAVPKQCRTKTQMLFDWSSPLTSLLAGLHNLLRIEPNDSMSVEISSGHDGLNELICIDLESDAGVVIEPRNVVGLVIKQGASVALHKHWEIKKLQSWLKWQFRYVTVSGPLTIILKGGRGLVVSEVHDELMLAPEYVVGFSTNLGYATSRTETFSGYYTRKKSLLNDRFIGERGLVIHQEANFGSGVHTKRHGLEGVVDGLLKAFGI